MKVAYEIEIIRDEQASFEEAARKIVLQKTVLSKADQQLWDELHSKEKPKASNVLTAFAKRHCTYWDKTAKECLMCGTCMLQLSQPCRHFEESVFPLCNPSYKYVYTREVNKYPQLLAQYRKINPNILVEDTEVRRCGCGAALKRRQRLCEKCRERKRRKTKREYQRKFRKRAS